MVSGRTAIWQGASYTNRYEYRTTQARYRSERKTDGILAKITEHIDDLEVRKHFLKTQQTWETFMKLQAEQRAGRVGKYAKSPGTISPLLYASEIEARINERIVYLEARYASDGRIKEGVR
jgi:hypothetical protein